MRTTISIDEDVLLAAKEHARGRGTSIGAVISDLARKVLSGGLPSDVTADQDGFFGFVALPKRGGRVTNELIDRLGEDGPY